MSYMKKIGIAMLCVTCFAGTACAGNTLQVKPLQIEVFNDDNVFAIDKHGKYQIGKIDGKWSEIYDLKEKGLSLLDLLVVTDSGVFLIGSESHLDTDKDTYYTGLIVLIDSENTTIKQWHSDSSFQHVSEFDNQLTLT